MTVSLKTQKMLWGKAAARCAMPDCRRHLVENISETDDPTLVGENCHIIADSDGGPRSVPEVPVSERNRYSNLILLCSNHHKIVDDNESVWTIERLRALKADHEGWVEKSLGIDLVRMRDDTQYADCVDEWVRRAHIDEWTAWSSSVLGSGQPRIRADVDTDLSELRNWLLGRIWPSRYPDLERAFCNFRLVLEDFHNVLCEHLEPDVRRNQLYTRKFYKIKEWDPDLYKDLLVKYNFHVDIVSDLMLELTRAANLVCDEVRRCLAHSFRLIEGHLIVTRGPDLTFSYVKFVPRYSMQEASVQTPYPGLDEFYEARAGRDVFIGHGKP